MDEKDLKIAALGERIGDLTRSYEDRIADLRVEITILTNQIRASEENSAEDSE